MAAPQNESRPQHSAPVGEAEVIPGTRRLYDENGNNLPGDASLLKHGDIVLVPQPTESPNDPLRWSLPRKIWHSCLVLYIVGLTAATSNNAGSGADGVNEEYGIGYDAFNTGAGVLFIAIGYWTLLSSPLVHLYGRRLGYLISMIVNIGGLIWYSRITNVAGVIWSQLFVGAAESVGEATVQLSLLDIWFEHQTGSVLGIYTFATAIGTYLGPLIGAYVSSGLGWRWIGYVGALICGGSLIVIFFGLEETEFNRDRYLTGNGERYPVGDVHTMPASEKTSVQASARNSVDIEGHDPTDSGTATGPTQVIGKEGHLAETTGTDQGSMMSGTARDRMAFSYSRRKTYWDRIRIITPAPNLRGTGFKQYLFRLWHTLRVFTFPAVWYAGLQWGLQNICLTFYLTVQEDWWYGPPWNYSAAAVGNMNLPTLIGSLVGCVYGGYGSDRFMLWMIKRNKGVMESEFRLYLMALCTVVFPTGMWLFGIGSARGWDWPVPYVGLGFIGFGYGCAGDLSLAYLADSFPEMVLEGMVGVAVINNTIAMLFTFVASYWIDSGMENCFIALGVLSFVIMGLSLPMIVFGKRTRRWAKDRYMRFIDIRDGFSK
ncbi:Major facilitator superfamily transporter [Colletotrichum higginsianum IMI 349063]|uniref:Major facilitator superfamily transporter n=4 Tax=Colletotrichum higginsianum TaxID=80884 RepID=A0A1B7XW12_COLHI|nr:Major facilitator superfamily transporter [Colletotrichum higginsianum IMI 349063]OBR03967.1 Major facilitator superfamily transporter [Colletotrichum higginsianum IMI 349063]TIC90077.1 Protein HOL1 [Colletotrichum higginsianum]GJD03671.1 major facilitator superfamily transporter [Colletotrichum higginsianum]